MFWEGSNVIPRIGGDSETVLRRVGRFGDGYMAMPDSEAAVPTAPENLAIIQAAAEAAGRDLNGIGLQARLNDPLDLEYLTRRVAALRAVGFTWTSVSLPSLEAAGLVGVAALVEALSRIRERLRRELG
jgi:alkanesulfonate monooxygenase SsuD/methylene tetrahydromethanopterin reductase-like flavin-dependent oxidoreductase (luciferase family)